jgi:amino acid transporter
LAIFPVFLKLRHDDPDTPRPYRFPGGNFVGWVAAVVCLIFIVQAIVFFIWVPGLPLDGLYTIPILVGIVVTVVVGELLLSRGIKHSPSN